MMNALTTGTETTVTAPYIFEEEIDVSTWNQLVHAFSNKIPVPIPIEDIVERYYKIPLEFEEMDKEILGYFDFGQRKIWINSCLEEESEKERLRFTVAHELGHYCLHSYYAQKGGVLYSKGLEFYKHNRSRLEFQANLFAGYFLMPTSLVLEAWAKITGSDAPYSLEDEQERNKAVPPLDFNIDVRSSIFTRDIAEAFEVSYTCASIQLKKLRLLY